MQGLVEQWDAIVEAQPADWSSLYLELRLRDAAQSEECALVICPLNPWHDDDWRSGVFHFRAARSFGYGAAAELCRKRLGTLDSLDVVGRLRLERRRRTSARSRPKASFSDHGACPVRARPHRVLVAPPAVMATAKTALFAGARQTPATPKEGPRNPRFPR